jgi:hypothetical protein
MAAIPNSSLRENPRPILRLEVRYGSARPTLYDVHANEFLIGSVPGCDLRLPGTNLPPVIVLLRRDTDAVRLRKLAPTLPIFLNGQPIASGDSPPLRNGDILSIGAVDLCLNITPAAVTTLPEGTGFSKEKEWVLYQQELEQKRKELEEQVRQLEEDRVLWYQRRAEIEKEIQAAKLQLSSAAQVTPCTAPASPMAEATRETLLRKEDLERMQLALREAAVRLKEQKQNFEKEYQAAEPKLREAALREQETLNRQQLVAAEAEELRRQRELFQADQRLAEERLRQRESQLEQREQEFHQREEAIKRLAQETEAASIRYRDDLVRIDRLSAALEAKEKKLNEQSAELELRMVRFRQDMEDFEEHIREFDEREERLKQDEARLDLLRKELELREQNILGRTSIVESQQAALAGLRTQLESEREELHALTLQANKGPLPEAEVIPPSVLSEAEKLKLQEQANTLREATERLHVLWGQLRQEDQRLETLRKELEEQANSISEQRQLLAVRSDQIAETHDQLEKERLAIIERQQALNQQETSQETLQEQLRLRAEELAVYQQDLDQRARELDHQSQLLKEELKRLEELRADAAHFRRLTEEEANILAGRDEKLQAAEQELLAQRQKLQQAEESFAQQQLASKAEIEQARAEIEELKQALAKQTVELLEKMPDLEQRAQQALLRTTQARESLRSQLVELHSFAEKSQAELETVRNLIRDDLDRLRTQEQALNRSKAEHRLAVASFRQQLIEWQTRFSELRQSLTQGEQRIGQREREVQATQQDLARRVENLAQQEREVQERRAEMEKHLSDMRQWYRKKLRQLVESKNRYTQNNPPLRLAPETLGEETPTDPEQERPIDHDMPPPPASESTVPAPSPVIPDDLEPGDRKLGELLRSLDLVDAETVIRLWEEAKRQRRSLRQILLANNFLTLYQLALIESGNLSSLVLDRFRIIDRISSSSKETWYRVFDPLAQPRTAAGESDNGVRLLRHLAEAEMLDAIHPDEYRQRFLALRDLAHPNVAATYEVLEISDRPAVVQEWLVGLSGADFPPWVSAPGVWHRLVLQAALALHAGEQSGLSHGRLTAHSFVLTRTGILKLVGLGEPPWLYPLAHSAQEVSHERDLQMLGQIALSWANAAQRKKNPRLKPFPPLLRQVLLGLGAPVDEGEIPSALYPSAAALIEDLDRASAQVPSDDSAWNKLLAQVDEGNQTRASA